MKIVISPAKSLDFDSPVTTTEFSQPIFLSEAQKLNEVLKSKSPKELSKLMSISDKLGELNWQRNQDWHLPFSSKNAKQAVYAFTGDVYIGLDVNTIPQNHLKNLQQQLRILSGQYGLLKPLDLMQPYRLEMGTKLKVGNAANLYEFWGNKITEALKAEMTENEVLVNLASNEYFKSVHTKELSNTVITPVFKDFKNGQLKMISFYAKKARGLMVRYIVDNAIEHVEDLKGFNYEGYSFDSNLSTKKELVFTR